ncbi:hypothetical protein [Frankia gtarii]|uniref:hypothetical protein n=1 Tax=Frankia gtarii TaxID=2950102 RepID=UPI0021BE502A|nr:hypothetical protein [Frankia gtarii]
MADESTHTVDEVEADDAPAEGELYEPSSRRGRVPAMPGVSVHFSKISGRYTAIVDVDTTAAQMTTALARYLPAGVRLVETLSHVGATMIVFQGEPDPPGSSV